MEKQNDSQDSPTFYHLDDEGMVVGMEIKTGDGKTIYLGCIKIDG